MSLLATRRFAIRRRLYPILERALLGLGAFRAGKELRHEPRRIIFVCSGNICRSPYAEAFARQCGLPAVSCGTHAHSGSPADPTAIAEAAGRGIALSEHQATRWRDVSLSPGDVIVAMQLRHLFIVLPRALAGRYTVLLFSSFLPQFAPIWDPYGRPREIYREVFDLIDIGVQHLAQWTVSALGGTPPLAQIRIRAPDRDCGDTAGRSR
jgi:protein-tyrosine phosphatase